MTWERGLCSKPREDMPPRSVRALCFLFVVLRILTEPADTFCLSLKLSPFF